ncbi:MAG: aminotransferase class I/II-fold pyridoxal phosphate-dependent enzyme [Bdellovibrio sp.]|nr:aminotransferase class I/II-fold pyridoxal phosphate-dependent enzyme [Bdellovibrio sp.]
MKNNPLNLKGRIRDLQHFGEEGGVVPGIDLAVTSTFLDPQDMEKTFLGQKEGCYLYSRHSNPTVNMFSEKMAALENTEAALGVASGMAAISSVIEQIMPDEGGEIISSLTVYGGTYALFKNIYPRQGIKTNFVDITDLAAVEKAITPTTKIIYTETMSNPLLKLSPLVELSKLAKKHNLKLIVDNTFAPCLVTPADLGADVVIHSCTKFISGSSDMIAGAICGTRAFISSLIDVNTGVVMLKGPIMDSRSAHELYMRLDHLPIRVQAHSKSAFTLASNLEKNGIKVIYPGLKSHPQYSDYQKILNSEFGAGGMVAVEMESAEQAMQLAQALQNIKFGLYAVSLGFSRTLMTVPAVTTSSEISESDQKLMNLKKGLLRLSIGYVGQDDVMLERFMTAYNAITQAHQTSMSGWSYDI